MGRMCAIIGCKSNKKTTTLYEMPDFERYACKEVRALLKERYDKWMSKLKRQTTWKQIKNFTAICGRHFLTGKPAELNEIDHPDWVPTQNLFNTPKNAKIKAETQLKRYERRLKRVSKHSRVIPKPNTKCFISNCSHNTSSHSCNWYTFPVKEPDKKIWIELIGRTGNLNDIDISLVCSCHFINGQSENNPTLIELEYEKKIYPSKLQVCQAMQRNYLLKHDLNEYLKLNDEVNFDILELESQPVFDLNKICRVCLNEDATETKNIFDDFYDNYKIIEMLRTTLPIETFSVSDKLPKQICTTCLETIKQHYEFYQKLLIAKQTLNTYIEKLEQEHLRTLQNCIYFEHAYGHKVMPQLMYEYVDCDYEPEMKNTNDVVYEEVEDEGELQLVPFKDTSLIVDLECLDSEIEKKQNEICNSDDKKYMCEKCRIHFAHYSQMVLHTCSESDLIRNLTKVAYEYLIDDTDFNGTRIQFRQCLTCDKVFVNLDNLVAHSCFAQTNSKRSLTAYDKRFQCIQCGEKFLFYSALAHHKEVENHQQHSPSIEVVLEIQKKTNSEIQNKINTETQNETQNKITNETPDKLLSFSCNKCDAKFEYFSQLFQHKRTFKHPKREFVNCKICNTKVKGTTYYSHHLKKHNPEIKKMCETCGAMFSNTRYLMRHSEIHQGIKRYKCDFCEKRFHMKSALDVHRRVHTGEKPFTCEQCGRRFRYGGGLNWHLNKQLCKERDKSKDVEIVKRFTCVVCNKTFASNFQYRKHLGTHEYLKE